MDLTNIPAGAPCWVDLMTSNPEQARAFYTALFGWTYVEGDEEQFGGYTLAYKDGLLVAGLMGSDPYDAGYPDMWSTYLRSDDIAATVAAVTAAGGVSFMPPLQVPGYGAMAMLGDPSGASVGVWEFGGMRGFQSHGVPGAPVWHELHSKDYESSVAFYQNVFGWQTTVLADTPEFRYTHFGDEVAGLAGIMDAAATLPEQVPSTWLVYFQVEDVDATVATALSLGATVVEAADDSSFGRLAGLSDPTGALFKIFQP